MLGIELNLGVMDVDMCLMEDKPTFSDDDSSMGCKSRLEKCERLNSLSLLIIKRTISETSLLWYSE